MNSIHYFNEIADKWNQMRQHYFKEDILPLIYQHVDFHDKVVADLGSGTGFMALEAAKTAKQVFAIDQSENMLKRIESQQKENVITLHSSIEKLVLTDNSVDVVTINMALHHIEDPFKTIQEAYRILKKGGTLLISDPMEHDAVWAHEEMQDVWLGFSLETILVWYEKAGFTHINVFDTGLKATAISRHHDVLETNIFMAAATKGA